MNSESDPEPAEHSYLRRLHPEAYRGLAYVHWSMTMESRKTGWLDESFHLRFREIQTHTGFRFGITCPMYCLMPEHFHLLWIGWRDDSDQRKAMRFLRRQLNWILRPKGFELQKQGHDNVLREKDRERDAFTNVATYIRNNPLRAGLIADEQEMPDWPYQGCVVPGYPELSIWQEDYWERFWKIYYLQCKST